MKQVKVFSYMLFVLVAFILPFFSFKGYSIINHTTSHLGAQGSPYAFIMNGMFVLLGLLSFYTFFQTKVVFYQVIGGLFGISLALTGVFLHGPLVEGIVVNTLYDTLHSVFASTTGFSFTFLVFGHAFMHKGSRRVEGILLGSISTLIPLFMVFHASFQGLYQRMMFLIAFYWIFFVLKVDNVLIGNNNGGTV